MAKYTNRHAVITELKKDTRMKPSEKDSVKMALGRKNDKWLNGRFTDRQKVKWFIEEHME